jgi:hypothetical protein
MKIQIKLDAEEQEILKAFEAGQTSSIGTKKIAELLAMHLQPGDELIDVEFPKSSDLPKVASFKQKKRF